MIGDSPRTQQSDVLDSTADMNFAGTLCAECAPWIEPAIRPRDLSALLTTDHIRMEAIFDRLQFCLDDRDIMLAALTETLRAHFISLDAVAPEIQRRILYPVLATAAGNPMLMIEHHLVQLEPLNPQHLDFDKILQRLIDVVMDQVDQERQVISAILVTFPVAQLDLLGQRYAGI